VKNQAVLVLKGKPLNVWDLIHFENCS